MLENKLQDLNTIKSYPQPFPKILHKARCTDCFKPK